MNNRLIFVHRHESHLTAVTKYVWSKWIVPCGGGVLIAVAFVWTIFG
jgi:hypothetical protein